MKYSYAVKYYAYICIYKRTNDFVEELRRVDRTLQ